MASNNANANAASSLGDVLFRLLCQAAGLFVVLAMLALIGVLLYQATPVLKKMGELQLFTSKEWRPNSEPPLYGVYVFIYGTVMSSWIAMLIAVPLGVGSAAFLSEIAPSWIRRTCAFLIELLAAIPSVVYGFWGLFFLAPAVDFVLRAVVGEGTKGSGQGILAAGVILAIMILPYITAISFDVCRAVPRIQREAAYSLGATRWQTIWTVVLPYARPGIIAACFLALGRAIGETMAVTMLIGNSPVLPDASIVKILTSMGDSIPSLIAKNWFEVNTQTQQIFITLALILFVITSLTNLCARLLISRSTNVRARPRSFRRLEASLTKPPDISPEQVARARSSALRTNRIMTWVLACCQILTIGPLFLILGYITIKGVAGLDLNLFTQLPKAQDQVGGGLGHAMLGTLKMVLWASVSAVPLGILAAVYLSEFRNHRMPKIIRFVAELLAGVPSIVIGIFSYSLLVTPFWEKETLGYSGWAGVFALSLMMLPVVIRTSEEAMRLVPNSLREASFALGASQWQTVVRVILPAAIPAIITGVLLAMGRIAGETAPLLLTAKGSNFWPDSLSESTAFLPGYIFSYATGTEYQRKQAWAASLVLLIFIVGLNVMIRLLAGKRQIAATQAG